MNVGLDFDKKILAGVQSCGVGFAASRRASVEKNHLWKTAQKS